MPSVARAFSTLTSPLMMASSSSRCCFRAAFRAALAAASDCSNSSAGLTGSAALLAPCGTGPPTPTGTGRACEGGSPMRPGPCMGHRSGKVAAMWSCMDRMACWAFSRCIRV